MIVAGVVIETQPGAAARVASRLAAVPGLRVEGDDGERRIAAVWEVADGDQLERLGRDLVARHDEILGVFPVYAGGEGGPEDP